MEDGEPQQLPEALTSEARRIPGGWVYQVAGDYDLDGKIPPSAIRGAWKVDDCGEVVGDFIPNLKSRSDSQSAIWQSPPGQVPQEGPFDYGHKFGQEWWRTQQLAREEGWTRQELIDYENQAERF